MKKTETASTGELSIEIDSRRTLWCIFAILFAIEALLFALDYYMYWQEDNVRQSIVDMFSTTEEHSIAGWFAATQTFVVALAVWAIVLLNRCSHLTFWRRAGWIVVAALFTYLSVDDGAAIHEHLGGGWKQTPGIGYVIEEYSSYSWHIVILPFFIAMGFFMLFFFWRELASRNEKIGVLAAFSCFTIAVGQDYIEGTTDEYDWFEEVYDVDAYDILHFAKSLEECLEMLGMTILLLVFLSHLMRTYRTLTLRFH